MHGFTSERALWRVIQRRQVKQAYFLVWIFVFKPSGGKEKKKKNQGYTLSREPTSFCWAANRARQDRAWRRSLVVTARSPLNYLLLPYTYQIFPFFFFLRWHMLKHFIFASVGFETGWKMCLDICCHGCESFPDSGQMWHFFEMWCQTLSYDLHMSLSLFHSKKSL